MKKTITNSYLIDGSAVINDFLKPKNLPTTATKALMKEKANFASYDFIFKELKKQSQAISKLAEYVDRINANSKAPFSDDVEEEIKKILE